MLLLNVEMAVRIVLQIVEIDVLQLDRRPATQIDDDVASHLRGVVDHVIGRLDQAGPRNLQDVLVDVEVGNHILATAGCEDESISPIAAVQDVVPGFAHQGVVAVTAEEMVVAFATQDEIVAETAAKLIIAAQAEERIGKLLADDRVVSDRSDVCSHRNIPPKARSSQKPIT